MQAVSQRDDEPITRKRSGATAYILGNLAAVLIGLLVAYAIVAATGVANAALLSLKTNDFIEYFSAARLIADGHGGQLYDFQALGHLQSSLIVPLQPPYGILPYLYPPLLALVLVPLAILPYNAAYLLWLLFDSLVLVVTLYGLQRYSGLRGRPAVAFRFGALTFLPVLMALGLGQVSIVLLALLTGAFVALRRQRPVAAGVLLALAFIKPPYIFPFLLLLAMRRDWRALLAFALATGISLLLPALLLGWSLLPDYLRVLLSVSSWQGRGAGISYQGVVVAPATYIAQWNHSFAGLCQLLLPKPVSIVAAFILDAMALAAVAWTSGQSRQVDVPFAVAVVAALLISPHTLAYDLTLLLIPAAIAVRYRGSAVPAVSTLLAVVYLAIAIGYPAAFFIPLQPSVLVMTLLGLWMVFHFSSQQPRPDEGDPPALPDDLPAVPISPLDAGRKGVADLKSKT